MNRNQLLYKAFHPSSKRGFPGLKKIAIIAVSLISVIIIIVLIAIISNFVNQDLNGMDITVIGDSIMKGYGNEDKGFEYYFSKNLYRSKINNYAQDAATLSDNNGTSYTVIKDEINNIKEIHKNISEIKK